MNITRIIPGILFVIFFSNAVSAQTKYNEAEFKTNPVWTKMINDPDVNYYQAVKAFNTYWEGKLKPEGEDDFINEKEKENKAEERERRAFEKKLKKMPAAERQEYDQLKYHYKRFETWMREVKPFVQEDGSILSEKARMNIWKKQQSEIRSNK